MIGWWFYLGTWMSLSVSHGRLVVLFGCSGELVSFLWKVDDFFGYSCEFVSLFW
jgi:hypothetical protein